MSNRYHFVDFDGNKSLTILVDGDLVPVTGDHPDFDEIYAWVSDSSRELDGIMSLVDPSVSLVTGFAKIGEQVAVRNGAVLFEGEEVNDLITDRILDFYNEGNEDFKPLVNFLEKLYANPNANSREQLYRWLDAQSLSITPSGDFVAYKSVQAGDLTSHHKGYGIVDGVEFENAYLPNQIGSTVEMPREMVTFDPSEGCSFGLHAGSWEYANGFGYDKVVLEVHINPRDVVSVPTHCNDQKLRTCRYNVVQKLSEAYGTVLVGGEETEDVDDDNLSYDDEDNIHYEYHEGERFRLNTDYYAGQVGDIVIVLDDCDPDWENEIYIYPEDNPGVGFWVDVNDIVFVGDKTEQITETGVDVSAHGKV